MTAAERQRRSRKHRSGDHSLCAPTSACVAPQTLPPVESNVRDDETSSPSTFGPRGAELWSAMDGVEMGPAHRVLLVEACRMADRLDRFERVLTGGRWFFDRADDDGRVEVVIDAVLSEARQYASALKMIVAELEPRPVASAKPVQRKAAGVTDLAARIAARRGQVPTG